MRIIAGTHCCIVGQSHERMVYRKANIEHDMKPKEDAMEYTQFVATHVPQLS
jgi:accessory colonization factor AcfC